jgi:NADPH:quinone reductase-like Zn-dependent oxidoreductase
MLYEDIDRPRPAADELLVRIEAAGVGPWDAWIRAGRSALPQPLPLTLGSDIAGIVEEIGQGVRDFDLGNAVYGATNSQFTGGYAQYAVVKAGMTAQKPATLNFVEAASLPVIASTAWQMLFDYAKIQPGQRVLILGASGSVGSIAVQLAHRHQAYTIAAASSNDAARLMHLGADMVLDLAGPATVTLDGVDAVIDASGGDIQRRGTALLKRGGYIVSAVSAPDMKLLKERDAQGTFFLVKPATQVLRHIADLVDRGAVAPRVGVVLPLSEARRAHRMLDGTEPYERGKIVLTVSERQD